jgi:opacity protein-like surface antigen
MKRMKMCWMAFWMTLLLAAVASPAVAQPSGPSFYGGAGLFADYDPLLEDLLGRRAAAAVSAGTGEHLAVGVILPFVERCALDLRLGYGTAEIEAPGLAADLEMLTLDVRTKVYLRPEAPCFQPYVSVGLRTGQISADGEQAEDLGFGRAVDFGDENFFDMVLGTGFEWPLADRLALHVEGDYGPQSGWRVTTGLRFGGSCCGGKGPGKRRECRAICGEAFSQCTASCGNRPERFRGLCETQCRERQTACRERCQP